MRIAAAVEWYAQERISQGKGAEIAGLSRAAFINELARRKISVCQVHPDELWKEVHG
jgi:predicted HTH domain antitoxin